MSTIVTDDKHYSDIANAIRAKNETNNKYKPSEMAAAINAIEAGGGSINKIVVKVSDGSVVTAVNENGKSYTATAVNGVAVLEVFELGIYTITANINGVLTNTTVEVKDDFEINLDAIYGISRDITLSSPEWARTDNAVGLTATASVGTQAGTSDFDNIYPWSEIKRETLPTGDVMVKIPKFYFHRYRDGSIEHIKISKVPKGGFILHPAFNHGGVETDCIYVGAYKSCANNYKSCSLSGFAPDGGSNRKDFRTAAREKGSGWNIIDISTLSAIQMLYLVEYANNNSQAMIGRGYCDGNSAKLITGTCDNVPNLTGRPTGTDGKTDIVYRGIEGIWGNMWEWVDGVNFNDGSYWVSNNPNEYADDLQNGHLLSYTIATNYSRAYITEFEIDTNGFSNVFLPSNAKQGSENTKWCDAVWSGSEWRVFKSGGDWESGSLCGLFTVSVDSRSSMYHTSIGSRLMYIPQ